MKPRPLALRVLYRVSLALTWVFMLGSWALPWLPSHAFWALFALGMVALILTERLYHEGY